MKKKHYLLPTMKVVELKQNQMLCASPGGIESLYEEELNSESFVEL